MQLINLKKLKKHMQFCLMSKSVSNMINLVMQHFLIMLVAELGMILVDLIFQIFLMVFLAKVALVLILGVEVIIEHQKGVTN